MYLENTLGNVGVGSGFGYLRLAQPLHLMSIFIINILTGSSDVCVCVCGHLDSDNTTAETSNVLSLKSAFTQHILASVLTCVSWP